MWKCLYDTVLTKKGIFVIIVLLSVFGYFRMWQGFWMSKMHTIEVPLQECHFEMVSGPCEENLNIRKDVAFKLKKIGQKAKNLQDIKGEAAVHLLEDIEAILNTVDNRNNLEKKFSNPQSSLDIVTCDTTSISSLVSILIDTTNVEDITKIEKLVASTRFPVILGVTPSQNLHVKSDNKTITVNENSWSSLAQHANTPFVLVGRYLTDFRDSDVTLLLRLLLAGPEVAAVGSSVKNESGFWNFDCFKVRSRNYLFSVDNYYEKSFEKCAFCDSLTGPFLTRAELVRNGTLQNDDVSILDWFLEVKHNNYVVLSCPEVVFDIMNNPVQKLDLLSFATKWQFEYISIAPNKYFHYNDTYTKIDCDPFLAYKSGILMSPSCVGRVNHAVAVLDEFTKLYNITFELDSGSVVGSLKYGGFMPWDLDGDVIFYTKNYSLFSDHRSFFLQRGVKPDSFSGEPSGDSLGFFNLWTPEVFIEIWGSPNMSVDYFYNVTKLQTVAKFGDVWIKSHVNPGLNSRSRYGFNILKHSQTWRAHNQNNSWVPYIPGRWLNCSVRDHHACLNVHPADGNIAFRDNVIYL